MEVSTVASLIIALFAILPGVPANWIFVRTIGSDWRMKDWEKIARILVFSALGFVVYSTVARLTKLPQPAYILPSTFAAGRFQLSDLPDISAAFLGHWVASAAVALSAGGIMRLLGQNTHISGYPSSWDIFIRDHVSAHWVVVGLTDGKAYAGMVSSADLSVPRDDRDLVLDEPALYLSDTEQYIALPYASLFLPSSLISSVATVHSPGHDRRVTEIDSSIFKGGN